MFMAPIVRTKPTVSPRARALVGVPVLGLSALVMVPWLGGYAIYAGVALSLRTLGQAPRVLREMVDYAGSVALGG